MGGESEVVNRSGRDKPICIIIHMCMEAMLRISLYSYLYLNLVKILCLSYYLLFVLFNKIGEEKGRTGSSWKRDGVLEGEGWSRAGERNDPNNVYRYE
jgi:hypothetical protein